MYHARSLESSFGIVKGPPTAPPNWFHRNAPIVGRKKLRASSLSLRRNSHTSPCHWFEPDFVTRLIVAPEACPYTPELIPDSTFISAIASGGGNSGTPSKLGSRFSTPSIVKLLSFWRWPYTEGMSACPTGL